MHIDTHKLIMSLASAEVAITAAAGAWGVLPVAWQPDVPEPVRWIVALVGVGLPALIGWLKHRERTSDAKTPVAVPAPAPSASA